MTALSLNHRSLKYDFNEPLPQFFSNSWNVQKDFLGKELPVNLNQSDLFETLPNLREPKYIAKNDEISV